MSAETLDLFSSSEGKKPAAPATRRHYKKSSDRRNEIMIGMVSLLSKPSLQRYTTKDIASEVGITESNIYRHYKSKSEILMGILDFCDESISEMFSKIDAIPDVSMMHRGVLKLQKLLAFGQMNPGISRILTGEALVYEDECVVRRKDEVLSNAQNSINNTYKLAIINNEVPRAYNHNAQTMLVMSLVLGRLLLYSQSHFTIKPTGDFLHFCRLIETV